jgi:hypothetical protein
MKVLVNAATLLVGYFLFVCPPAFSQEQGAFLTPAQTKTYHACLTAEWVEDYCRSHAWGIFGTYDRTKRGMRLCRSWGAFSSDWSPFCPK